MKFITTTQTVTRTEEVTSISRDYCCDEIKKLFEYSFQPSYLMSPPVIIADDKGVRWAWYSAEGAEWKMEGYEFKFCPFCGSKIEFFSNRP